MRVTEAKSFDISKREVWEAYKRVKAKRGAAGGDGVTIAMFEQDLSKNLYRIWNRMLGAGLGVIGLLRRRRKT